MRCDTGAMTGMAPIQGELQTQLMGALWRINSGNVEQVRAALPPRYRGAYTTIQTVLNRLTERGLLARERAGQKYVYRPKLTEAEYLSRSIEHTLAFASADARQAALVQLISGLEREEVADLQRLAAEAQKARKPSK